MVAAARQRGLPVAGVFNIDCPIDWHPHQGNKFRAGSVNLDSINPLSGGERRSSQMKTGKHLWRWHRSMVLRAQGQTQSEDHCTYRADSGHHSGVELFDDEFVEEGGVGLALADAHDLAYEERGYRALAAFELGYLRGVRGDDLVDHSLDGGGVGDLLRLVAVVDEGEVAALGEAGV